MNPFPLRNQTARRGSWLWTVRVAEITAWGTVALILLVVQLAGLEATEYVPTLMVTGALALWLWVFFHILIFRPGAEA